MKYKKRVARLKKRMDAYNTMHERAGVKNPKPSSEKILKSANKPGSYNK